jgi:hypothetical protein
MTAPLYGGLLLASDDWDASWDGVDAGTLVLPDEQSDAWTDHQTGNGAAALSRAILALTSPSALDGMYYEKTVSGLTYSSGAVLEARVKITASSTADDTGFLFCINAGECQHRVWLRTDGLNIDGFDEVELDLTSWHVIRVVASGIDTRVYIDDNLVASGHFSALKETSSVLFGAVPGYGYATANVSFVRARDFFDYEELEEAGWLSTIGPEDFTIEDLAKGSAIALTVDHSSTASFSLAEPPTFTDQDDDSLHDQGIYVQLLGEMDGDGFTVLVTNVSYDGDYGYSVENGYGYGYEDGTTLPDIYLRWRRTGLVAL